MTSVKGRGLEKVTEDDVLIASFVNSIINKNSHILHHFNIYYCTVHDSYKLLCSQCSTR